MLLLLLLLLSLSFFDTSRWGLVRPHKAWKGFMRFMRLYKLESPMQGSIYSSYLRKLVGRTVWDRQLTHNVHLISCTCLLQAAGILHSGCIICAKLRLSQERQVDANFWQSKLQSKNCKILMLCIDMEKNCAWQRQNAAWWLLLLLLLLPVAIADEPIPKPAGLAGQETTKQNHTITLCIADTGA